MNLKSIQIKAFNSTQFNSNQLNSIQVWNTVVVSGGIRLEGHGIRV